MRVGVARDRGRFRGGIRSAVSVRRVAAVVTAVGTLMSPGLGTVASAEPLATIESITADAAPDGSRLVGVAAVGDTQMNLTVHSTAMDKDVTVRVIRATSQKRPTVYMLGGVEGNSERFGWEQKADVEKFFSGKNVNVVIPFGGQSSYYADWQHDDPKLGRNKWQTFLTRELPPIVDSALETSGKNAIAGLSMSATSVLNLAISRPGLYQSVGAYSGCAMTSDPVARRFVEITVSDFGGNPENMWGAADDPLWAANDPYVNADKLRGTTLYISNGSGLPGPYDTLDARTVGGDRRALATQVVVGGVIEAVTNDCTMRLAEKLRALDIPATVDLRPVGTHSWGYWRDDLSASWPMMAAAIDA
ncbi:MULTISPECIES: alpha/beta hydrolase family protein [unclassified Rhodococcus (in: high G+C Gram-positive bacteria)]|uniref:alpha/beta hydrolase n=1 Tax=unclassified Rhodococcus (in: high G+C Gram-positive bacteria) TaxID=192944 RepID=UPI0016395883|nr:MULTISPECIES: alpha/beta hydrolase family protein [unclassified Rhodococcus (in: high G+C Gram-positive bacteria)]MBC2642783.1 esterase family protein [Rhodococcus sp. 3A]MBC2892475.1 esterase family protein [Rhodococcus sp. 4CII]